MNDNQLQEIKDLLDGNESETPEDTENEDNDTSEDPILSDTTEGTTDSDSTEDTPEDETEEDEEDTKDEDTDNVEDTDDFPKDIASLAKAIEVDPKDLYNININMPDGMEPVTIGDLKNQFTEAKRNEERLLETIQEQEKALKSNTPVNTPSQQKIELMAQMEGLKTEYETTDWAQLEQSDPGAAALLHQKFNEASIEVQTQLQQIDSMEHQQTEQQLREAADLTLKMIPEWTDESTRTQDLQKIEKLLVSEGLDQQAIGTISDPITIKLLNELAHLREKDKQASDSLQKIKKVPKRLKVNSARKPNNLGKKTESLINKAKQSNKQVDQIAAAKALLGMNTGR